VAKVSGHNDDDLNLVTLWSITSRFNVFKNYFANLSNFFVCVCCVVGVVVVVVVVVVV